MWVVDTCILIDIAEGDPEHGRRSAKLVDRRHKEGLLLCPVTFVELAPVFDGELALLKTFLRQAGVQCLEGWTSADSERAFSAWDRHIALKRKRIARKRPIADVLIGAFASRFSGLITRNPDDFHPWFHDLKVLCP